MGLKERGEGGGVLGLNYEWMDVCVSIYVKNVGLF